MRKDFIVLTLVLIILGLRLGLFNFTNEAQILLAFHNKIVAMEINKGLLKQPTCQELKSRPSRVLLARVRLLH